MTTNTNEITNEQIETLRTEAAQHGDYAQVRVCDLALAGEEEDISSRWIALNGRVLETREDARAECARVLVTTTNTNKTIETIYEVREPTPSGYVVVSRHYTRAAAEGARDRYARSQGLVDDGACCEADGWPAVVEVDVIVRDYATGKALDGSPSLALLEASGKEAEGDGTGAVCAYRDDDGTWQYVAESQEDFYRRQRGIDVRTVYVERS